MGVAVRRRIALVVLTLALMPGCYLFHERADVGRPPPPSRDASTDAPRPRDAARDAPAGSTCTEEWRRVDLGVFRRARIGPVAASRSTIAWIGLNTGGVVLTRLDRWTSERTDVLLAPVYSQNAAVLPTGDGFVLAYEHTGLAGENEGVWLTTAEDGVDGAVVPPFELSPTGGDPELAVGRTDGRVLVAYYDEGAMLTEQDLSVRAPSRSPVRVDDDTRLWVDVTTTADHALVSHANTIVRFDPETLVGGSVFADTSDAEPFRRLVSNTDAVFAEQLGSVLRTWSLDGTLIARDSAGDDVQIAAYQNWFLRVDRRTGTAAVVSPSLDHVYDPGTFITPLAQVGPTTTGFVVLSADLPVANDPLVTLIDRCADLP